MSLTDKERALLRRGDRRDGIDFNNLAQYSLPFLLHAYFLGRFCIDLFEPLSNEIKRRLQADIDGADDDRQTDD